MVESPPGKSREGSFGQGGDIPLLTFGSLPPYNHFSALSMGVRLTPELMYDTVLNRGNSQRDPYAHTPTT